MFFSSSPKYQRVTKRAWTDQRYSSTQSRFCLAFTARFCRLLSRTVGWVYIEEQLRSSDYCRGCFSSRHSWRAYVGFLIARNSQAFEQRVSEAAFQRTPRIITQALHDPVLSSPIGAAKRGSSPNPRIHRVALRMGRCISLTQMFHILQ